MKHVLSAKYIFYTYYQEDKFLPDAQNFIAEFFLDNDYDYLLLLDDDHWGHTPEMLECLINADSLIATMKTYSRHYPYCCALMRKVSDNTYIGIEDGKGYQEIDMCGFPMTLIKREFFEKIDKPYFSSVEINGRNWHTDVPFYERLSKLGIKPTGCFQHCLPHDIVTEENVKELRYKEIKDKNKKVMLDTLIRQGV